MKRFYMATMVIGFMCGTTMYARGAQAPPAAATVQAPAAPTELEQLRMQAVSLINQLNEQTKATHRALEERDDARLQMALMQAAPVREGFVYDWSVGRFREPKSGQVWDFEKKALVDDEKTPKKPDIKK